MQEAANDTDTGPYGLLLGSPEKALVPRDVRNIPFE
jgi:hypothetical protein